MSQFQNMFVKVFAALTAAVLVVGCFQMMLEGKWAGGVILLLLAIGFAAYLIPSRNE